MSLRARSESSGAVDASRGGVRSQSMSCVLPYSDASRMGPRRHTFARLCAGSRAGRARKRARDDASVTRASSVTSSASCGRDAREGARSVEWNAPSWLERANTSLGGGGGAQRAILRLAIGCAGCVGGVGVSRGLVTCATACVGAAAPQMGRFQRPRRRCSRTPPWACR